jgi:hypothetical protein
MSVSGEDQQQLIRRIGRALLGAAPPGWKQIRAEYRSAGRHIEADVLVTGEDGQPHPIRPPMDVVELLGELRTAMYQPGRGTWMSGVYLLDHPSKYSAEFEPDTEPRWRRVPPPIGFQDELRRFPREDSHIPEWLRARAGLPSVQPAPGQSAPGQPALGQPPVGHPGASHSAPSQPVSAAHSAPGQPAPGGQPASGQPPLGYPGAGQPPSGQPASDLVPATPDQPTPSHLPGQQPTFGQAPGQPIPGESGFGHVSSGQPTFSETGFGQAPGEIGFGQAGPGQSTPGSTPPGPAHAKPVPSHWGPGQASASRPIPEYPESGPIVGLPLRVQPSPREERPGSSHPGQDLPG